MHQRHRGPKLDMHKFDGTDPIGWVSQMEHFFFLHNICMDIDKVQQGSFIWMQNDGNGGSGISNVQGTSSLGLTFPKPFVLVLIGNPIFYVG